VRRALLPALLAAALSTACAPGGVKGAVYAPWEEGLTLVFENPRLPDALRREARFQVRVAKAPLHPSGERQVHLTLTDGTGQVEAFFVQKGGAVERVEGDRRFPVLPEGFPRVDRWSDPEHHLHSWVLGRGAWEGGSVRLDDDAHRVGVWVETGSDQDPAYRRRSLLLPDLGEVEAYDWVDGRWLCSKRLVGRGWVDEVPLGGA
jgi:hypothetical protein